MSKVQISEIVREPLTLAEVKQFLRIETAEENALLSMWISLAREACEQFTGRALITQDWRLDIAAARRVNLSPGPVQQILQVTHIMGQQSEILDSARYELVRQGGDAELVFENHPGQGRLLVEFRTGYGDDWNAVPLSLRQGMLRLVGHYHRFRDASDAPAMPAAVSALWRPFRVYGL